MTDFLNIDSLCKSYKVIRNESTNIPVLSNLSLSLKQGELVSIFGPNGCGKTTLLNIVAGIVDPDSGEVTIDGKHPQNSRVGYVLQRYPESLYPWLRAIDNIAFPLELQGIKKKERRGLTRDLIKMLDLQIPENAYPYELSGGQKQLVAIARALIYKPDILLMDEPFSALDFSTRTYMQMKIQDIWTRTGITFIFVSHEIEEAILMADRVVVLSSIPSRVLVDLEVSLPRPRKRNAVLNTAFLDVKRQILNNIPIRYGSE